MLTADLVRAGVRRGRVVPRYVDPADPRLRADAEELVALVRAHVGRPLGALEEAIADHIGDSTDYLVWRGLVKLLLDRATVEVVAARPPEEVRAAVFEEAVAAWPVGPPGTPGLADRDAAVARAAARLGLAPAEVEAALYADLKAEGVVTAVDAPDVDALLARYNLALAQGVLLKAREVRVRLAAPTPARARQLLRMVKFHRLMHTAERDGDDWLLTLDGPLSLFRQTQRYGLQLALFLPSLCRAEAWSLEADVAWGTDRRELAFHVDAGQGLRPHGRDTGTWESDEERHLRAAWKKLDTPWRLRRATQIVDLDGRAVLVPDYELRHEDGRVALLEIVWFWRRRTFERRLALLREAGPPNLVVALATRMNAGEDDLPDLPGEVVPFKGVIVPARLVEAAERLAH